MLTEKQVFHAFCVLGAKGLQFKKVNNLYCNIAFLIGSNWVKFDKLAILNLQAYKIEGGAIA